MSQTTLPPAPDVPGDVTPDSLLAQAMSPQEGDFPVPTPGAPGGPGRFPTPPAQAAPAPPRPQEPLRTDQVAATMPKDEMPTLADPVSGRVELPAGWLRPDGLLITHGRVRELNGYDEEKLSRVMMQENPSVYFTEMLTLGVEDLGGEHPDKDILRSLLIGDRDALCIGIRMATYGREVEFNLDCTACDAKSIVTVDLIDDIPVKHLDDPTVRDFEVELQNGHSAKLVLLDGRAQEAITAGFEKRTNAEINSIMLSKSVIAIDGTPTNGKEDSVRRLSIRDRATLVDFVVEHQPGPEISKEMDVHCSKCGAAYPISLGLPSIFRF